MTASWELRTYKALAIGAAGLLIYWAADRSPPMSLIADEPEGEARIGGMLTIRSEVIRHRRDCRTKVEQMVVDGGRYRHVLDDLEFAAVPGPLGRDVYRRTVQLRSNTLPGLASFRIIVSWRCNPLHELWPIVLSSEVPFTLLPASP